MDNDDVMVGRVLTRRDAVRLMVVGGAALAAGCGGSGDAAAGAQESAAAAGAGATRVAGGEIALPACVVRPEVTVGPYFLDKQLDRADIRAEPTTGVVAPGAPLALAFTVSEISNGSCRPLAGAMVDLWQCDAKGVYAGFVDNQAGFDTTGKTFLRGYQVTDANGVARFTTIYPGWYRGRTAHVHFKIRTPVAAALADNTAQTYEFTSQLFFDDALSDRVYSRAPYAGRGTRDTTNANDGILRATGTQLIIATRESGDGFTASFDVGLDLTDKQVGGADRSGGPGGRRGRNREL